MRVHYKVRASVALFYESETKAFDADAELLNGFKCRVLTLYLMLTPLSGWSRWG